MRKEVALEKVLKALANRRRIAIIVYLNKHSGAPVGDIADAIKLSFGATSRHLMLLTAADIIERGQVGLFAKYTLVQPANASVRAVLAQG